MEVEEKLRELAMQAKYVLPFLQPGRVLRVVQPNVTARDGTGGVSKAGADEGHVAPARIDLAAALSPDLALRGGPEPWGPGLEAAAALQRDTCAKLVAGLAPQRGATAAAHDGKKPDAAARGVAIR